MTATVERPIVLGGRRFRQAARFTVLRDSFSLRQIHAAGLDAVAKEEAESAELYARRLLETMLVSENMLTLLGCFIQPEELDDLKWTPDVAAETGKWIGQLHDPDDRLEVQRLMLAVLIPFLQSGLASLTASRRSSNRPDEESAADKLNPATTQNGIASGRGAVSSAS